MGSSPPDNETRQRILQAALRSFADRGYAATSVQQIVDAANVSKPVLYYYFTDKADLFHALVDRAQDERYRLMKEAAAAGRSTSEKLEHLVAAIFEYALHNGELMRMAFVTAFGGAGQVPGQTECARKGRRNFDFIKSLVAEGQVTGELDNTFSSEELAMAIFGQMTSYVMLRLLMPECPLNRETAHHLVALFLQGALRRSRGARLKAKISPVEAV